MSVLDQLDTSAANLESAVLMLAKNPDHELMVRHAESRLLEFNRVYREVSSCFREMINDTEENQTSPAD